MSGKKKLAKSAKVVIKDQAEQHAEQVEIVHNQLVNADEDLSMGAEDQLSDKMKTQQEDEQVAERDPIISAAILVVAAILVSGIMISASILYMATSSARVDNSVGGSDEVAEDSEPKTAEVEILSDDPYIGGAEAQVVMVEFSDYECPFCQRYHLNTYPEIKSTFIDTNKIGYVWKDFPLSFHDPLATQQAVAAQCVQRLAGSQKYFEYADKIFQTTQGGGTGMEENLLNDLAVEIGVNKDEFDKCADNEETLAKVKSNIEAGTSAGIAGTPGFVIGVVEDGMVKGEVVSGALPFTNFEDIIESYLEKSQK